MLQDLTTAANKTVGFKQTMKALKADKALKVYLAADVEEHIALKIREQCLMSGTELEMAGSMRELGEACGIQIGAATAAVLK